MMFLIREAAVKVPVDEAVYQVVCELANYFLGAVTCISICPPGP